MDLARKTATLTYQSIRRPRPRTALCWTPSTRCVPSQGQWHIAAAQDVTDPKRNAGASSLLDSIPHSLAQGRALVCEDQHRRTDVISAGKQSFDFFPPTASSVSRRFGAISASSPHMPTSRSRCGRPGLIEREARTRRRAPLIPPGSVRTRADEAPTVAIATIRKFQICRIRAGIWLESTTGLRPKSCRCPKSGAAAQFAQAVLRYGARCARSDTSSLTTLPMRLRQL